MTDEQWAQIKPHAEALTAAHARYEEVSFGAPHGTVDAVESIRRKIEVGEAEGAFHKARNAAMGWAI